MRHSRQASREARKRRGRRSRRSAGAVLATFLLGCSSAPLLPTQAGSAAELLLTPGLSLTGECNDNAAFARSGRRSDLLSTLTPELRWESVAERLALGASASVDVVRHARETYLDETRETIRGTGTLRATERVKLSLGASYRKDSTLEAELETAGLVRTRSERRQFGAEAGVSYVAREGSELEFGYRHLRTLYGAEREADYDLDAARFTWRLQLDDRPSYLVFRPEFTRTASEGNRSAEGAVLAGWTGRVGAPLELTALAGGSYALLEGAGRETRGRGGVRAEFSGTYAAQTASVRVGYDRESTYVSGGEPLDSQRVQLTLRKSFSSRLAGTIGGSLRRSRNRSEADRDHAHYGEASLQLQYRLAEHRSLRLGYSYARAEGDGPEGAAAERNRLWLGMDLTFPREW